MKPDWVRAAETAAKATRETLRLALAMVGEVVDAIVPPSASVQAMADAEVAETVRRLADAAEQAAALFPQHTKADTAAEGVTPHCLAVAPFEPYRMPFVCTEPRGHYIANGTDHVAQDGDGVVLARWAATDHPVDWSRSAAVEPPASAPAAEPPTDEGTTAASLAEVFKRAEGQPCLWCGGRGLHACNPPTRLGVVGPYHAPEAFAPPEPLTDDEVRQLRGLLAERAKQYAWHVEDQNRRVAESLGLTYTPNPQK